MKTLQDKLDFEKLEDEFNNYILSPYTTKVSASTMAHFLWFRNKLSEFHKAASSRTEELQKEIEELKAKLHKHQGPAKSCPHCSSFDVIWFTDDLDLCKRCGRTF